LFPKIVPSFFDKQLIIRENFDTDEPTVFPGRIEWKILPENP